MKVFSERLRKRLAHFPGLANAMNNSLALAGERIVKLGITFLITARLAGIHGPAEFGVYSTILALTTALAVTADLGTSRVILRELVRRSAPESVLLGTAFGLRSCGGFLSAAMAYLLSVWTISSNECPASTVHLIAASFAVGWILRSLDVVDFGFQAQSSCIYPVSARIVAMIASAGVQLWMISLGAPLYAFAIAFAVESLFASLGTLVAWHWRGGTPIHNWICSSSLVHRFLMEGWPMYAAALFSIVYYRSDLVIVNRLCSAEQAGLYASASRLQDLMTAPIPMLNIAIFPLLARWYDDKHLSFRYRYTVLTRWTTAVFATALMTVAVLSHHILLLFYGPPFVEASGILSVQCMSGVLLFNGFLRSSYLNLAARQRILLWTSLLSAALNVCLNYLLVSRLGAIGAAYSGVVTQLFSLTALNLFWSETRWLTFAHCGFVVNDSRKTAVSQVG